LLSKQFYIPSFNSIVLLRLVESISRGVNGYRPSDHKGWCHAQDSVFSATNRQGCVKKSILMYVLLSALCSYTECAAEGLAQTNAQTFLMIHPFFSALPSLLPEFNIKKKKKSLFPPLHIVRIVVIA